MIMSNLILPKADFLNKIKYYFDKLPIDVKGKTLCVCLSGGADSVSLLRGLLMISDNHGFNLCACHFNHSIRGEEADRDEEFCKSLCADLGIKIYCGRDDVPAYAKLCKMSLEEAARECRYSFFDRILSKKSVDFCVTAHNKNDDAETLLLNLIRGSGSNGASTILPYGENILRPLLNISRDEIEAYLKSIDQEYVTDSTNFSNDYTRNYIRNILIPEIEKLNPSVIDAFSRFTTSSRVDRDYFEAIVSDEFDSDLRTLHKAVRDRIILKKCRSICGKVPNFTMMSEIDKALFSDKRCIVSLFDGYEMIVSGGKIDVYTVCNDCIGEVDTCELIIGDNFCFGNRVNIVVASECLAEGEKINKLYTSCILSFDNISQSLFVRNRRVGDKICINGINKSLKKLFIDKKIPKEYRDIIPIIFDDKGIIYVPFVGVADRAKATKEEDKRYIKVVFNTIDKERWSNAYEK